jgi:hypothetical protein
MGDGEWNAILGTKTPHNCDGHIYYPDMSEALRKVLISKPGYYIGMQDLAMRIKGKEIKEFKKKHNLNDLKWFNADILHRASARGKIATLFDLINTRHNIILVGPSYLDEMKNYITLNGQVVIPELNCWKAYKEMSYSCSKLANSAAIKNKDILFLVCASMPAKILINDIYSQYNERMNISLLDIGSLFDPFCGKNSRGYHRSKNIVKINGF